MGVGSPSLTGQDLAHGHHAEIWGLDLTRNEPWTFHQDPPHFDVCPGCRADARPAGFPSPQCAAARAASTTSRVAWLNATIRASPTDEGVARNVVTAASTASSRGHP